ncbi:glycosyltransferase [Methylovorus sp. MP688]|uniref:glycosyltransferase n=1 Tax=Methylovorus sp. (strain MP688) TaxID=887061 RepID=UPI0001EC4326|nr:glycosyltransferase [Methylovorus sp. MP688]ADQ83298.1 glycosyl transferase [Methylovorus sp. MP688]
MSRILFVTSSHPGGEGFIGAGEGVCESNLRNLIQQGHEVHVVCFSFPSQHENAEVVKLCKSYTVIEQSRWTSVLGILCNWSYGSLIAPWFFTRCSPGNRLHLKQKLETSLFDSIWIEFPSSLGFVSELKKRSIDYFVHDIVFQKVSRRPLLSLLKNQIGAIENRLSSHAERCHVMAEKDAVLLRNIGYAGEISVAPLHHVKAGVVPEGKPAWELIKSFAGRRNLVFFGNMQRAENHWSIVHFILFHFPKIKAKHPDACLWVVGIRPRFLLRVLAKFIAGIEITGAVDDPSPLLAAATLCIAPLRYGAGVKIKVLQMVDSGATVIATTIAAEGVAPDKRLIIADGKKFDMTVCEWLDNPDHP